MVDVVGTVSSIQSTALKSSIQSQSSATPTPPSPISNINFVESAIYVNNLQNVAILEYRSSQTGQIVQQYPNQAQINAFKAAERLAALASEKPEDGSKVSAPSSGTTDAVHTSSTSSASASYTSSASASSASTPSISTAPAPVALSSGSSGGTTTSIVA